MDFSSFFLLKISISTGYIFSWNILTAGSIFRTLVVLSQLWSIFCSPITGIIETCKQSLNTVVMPCDLCWSWANIYGSSVGCTEVCVASFLSGGFTTMAVINPLERKLAKRTSVGWHENTRMSTQFLSPIYIARNQNNIEWVKVRPCPQTIEMYESFSQMEFQILHSQFFQSFKGLIRIRYR